MIAGGKGVYRAESVELPTHPSFPVRYPGRISRRTWAPDLRFADLNDQVTGNVIRKSRNGPRLFSSPRRFWTRDVMIYTAALPGVTTTHQVP